MTLISLFGGRLREERLALGLSQQEAAAVASVTREHWGRCERGAAIPGGEMLAGFSMAGADIVYVLTGERTNRALTPDLSPKERVLLDAYRSGTDEQRDFILKAALGFAGTSEPPVHPQARTRDIRQKVKKVRGIMMAGGTVIDGGKKKN